MARSAVLADWSYSSASRIPLYRLIAYSESSGRKVQLDRFFLRLLRGSVRASLPQHDLIGDDLDQRRQRKRAKASKVGKRIRREVQEIGVRVVGDKLSGDNGGKANCDTVDEDGRKTHQEGQATK